MELKDIMKGLQLIKTVKVDYEKSRSIDLCDKEAEHLSLGALDEVIELLQIEIDNQEENK